MAEMHHIALDKPAEELFLNMLLVEDNSTDAELLQDILKHTVFCRSELTQARGVWEAIALLHKESFDLILLDLTLPDHDGLHALDLLIQQAPDLPIVVLTHRHDDELAVEAVRHGAQDYLVKQNIYPDLLVRSLQYAIHRKQTAEVLREANEILEQRVLERTYELEATNKRLQREIEHRQQVQERLELAQKAGKIGTFEWNIQSNEVMWSPELEALYGQPPGSFENRYSCWLETLHPDDRFKTEQELWQAIQCGQGLETEFRIILPGGEIRWLTVKSSLFHDAKGTPLRMIGIHMDITEKKEFEIQFLRAQRLESLGTLTSGIAHDLNNVFTPILSVVQLLPIKMPNLTASARQMLEILASSTNRGVELVRQILSFSHGIEGKRINLQIHHVLLESQTIIEQTFPKSITIESDIPTDLWAVCGDVTQLHQVFMNLLLNARDAIRGNGELEITARNQRLDELQARIYPDAQVGDYVVICIRDTGIGIPPENLHHIFDPFFTTKKSQKGTGLGLSAVLGIVKSHGGFIDVKSELGKGSTFKIYLPASQARTTHPVDDLTLLSGQQELILVVDDEAAICAIIKTMLENYNYRVITASDGAEAIALFAEYKDQINSVLIDMMMPGMDGAAILPVLRQFNPQIRAIAMSGIHSIEAIAQSEHNGFTAFLPKPFDTVELLRLLRAKMLSPQPSLRT